MYLKKVGQLYNTVKYLKGIQIYYRLFYFIRNRLLNKKYVISETQLITYSLNCYHYYNPSSQNIDNSFTFLNKTKTFNDAIDWNFSDYGKLWTYNLNYFEFLNQPSLTKEKGLELIEDYIRNNNILLDGLEPYPISLRTINWIKFLSKNDIQNNRINQLLDSHYKRLSDNLEYHLLGNHLLENAFSLLFGAYFFKDDKLYIAAKNILERQLKEQILDDGAHFELSPMYHQILLFKVLDAIYLIKNNTWKEDSLVTTLIAHAEKMLFYLKTVTFKNGNIPMVGDSAFNIAPTTQSIITLATLLEINEDLNLKLQESGYRKTATKTYELFFDVGNVGPKYQPGHAHSDTFNFELYYKNNPFIVDRGISTYEKNSLRQIERGTASHNTVMVENVEQTDVWGGFRVGARAEITSLVESENRIVASHDGYKKLGIMHERCIDYAENGLVITDTTISNNRNKLKKKGFLHFHPSIKSVYINNQTISFDDLEITINFEKNCQPITLEKYDYCLGFNTTTKAIKIGVEFNDSLVTKINM